MKYREYQSKMREILIEEQELKNLRIVIDNAYAALLVKFQELTNLALSNKVSEYGKTTK